MELDLVNNRVLLNPEETRLAEDKIEVVDRLQGTQFRGSVLTEYDREGNLILDYASAIYVADCLSKTLPLDAKQKDHLDATSPQRNHVSYSQEHRARVTAHQKRLESNLMLGKDLEMGILRAVVYGCYEKASANSWQGDAQTTGPKSPTAA
jgi:hypothetical protein